MLTKATDLSIVLENRPGTLANATTAIASAGVNIDGISGAAEGGRSFHLLFIKGAAEARMALERAGIEVKKESEVVLVDVQDHPGAAAAVLRTLAQHELNVDLAYLATNNRIVIGGDKVQRIWEVLAAQAVRVTA